MLTHADVPSGFEGLIDGQVEQLEVRVAGMQLGLHAVLVQPDSVTFQNPDALARRMVDAKISVPVETLAAALEKRLPSNRHLACGAGAAEVACGFIATDAVAVLHDEAKGAVEIFVPRAWLPDGTSRDARWHTATPAANALVHRHALHYSDNADYRALSANGIGALGIGERGHAGFEWQYTRNRRGGRDESRFAFDDAYYRQDLGRTHYVQGGRMDAHGLASPLGGNFNLALLPIGRIDGVRAGTTLAWVDRGKVGHGTPVTIVLSQRARVDAFRGAQLLSTSYLDAGLQAIDTAAFPLGSYPVTLRVIENGRETRSETVAFSRTGGDSAGSDQWQWFAQAGRAVDGPRPDQPDELVQFGVRLPLRGATQLSNATTLVGDGRAYNESRLDWHGASSFGAWNVSAAALIGSDGTRGDLQQVGVGRSVAWNLYRQSVRARTCDADEWPAPRGCQSSLTSTLSFPLAGGALTAGYTQGASGMQGRRNEGLDATFARSFAVRGGMVSMRMGAYRRDEGGLQDSGVHAAFSFSRHRAASGVARSSRHQSASVEGRTARRGQDTAHMRATATQRWEGSVQREWTMLAAVGTQRNREASIDARMDGRFGAAGGSVSHYDGHSGASHAMSAFHNGSLAISRDGLFFGAGSPGGEAGAGVVVRVRDDARVQRSGVAARVSGPGGGDVQLGFGEAMLMPMQGYAPARTHVGDGDASRASLGTVVSGAGRRDWFLPPGKLGLHPIDATMTVTYVGRLVDSEDRPLSRVLLLETPMAQTGDDGSFVAEFDGHPERMFALDPLQLHVCELGAPKKDDALQRIGQTRCRPGDVAELPRSLRDGERFKQWALRRVANLHGSIEGGKP